MSLVLDSLYLWSAVLLVPHWAFRAVSSRRYRAGWLQRLGLVPQQPPERRRIWLHCASVGEAVLTQRLVDRLTAQCPGDDVVFSACTDTGVERLRAMYPGRTVFFLPCDLTPCIATAVRRIHPSLLVLVEQELWPNMLQTLWRSRVPVMIVNGRMNAASSRLARCMFRLMPDARRAVTVCCARSGVDARRFAYAGIDPGRIRITGSMKYDALPTALPDGEQDALREGLRIAPGDRVIVGGSTHSGEELALARIWRRLRSRHPSLRLLIAPRHVERAAPVAAAIRREGIDVRMLSEPESAAGRAERDAVVLIDRIGRLVGCYAMADVVFVGRSLRPPGGGQNMMEPAALGKPVVTGPYTGNFRPEMEALNAREETVRVAADEAHLEEIVGDMLEHPEEAARIGRAARDVVMNNRGAVRRTLAELQTVWKG